jgi:hypothetical protein
MGFEISTNSDNTSTALCKDEKSKILITSKIDNLKIPGYNTTNESGFCWENIIGFLTSLLK